MFGRKSKPQIRFVSGIGAYNVGMPIIPASEQFPDFARKQAGKKFSKCPGMLDLARQGYLLRAWGDIEIMANSSGCVVNVDLPASIKGRIQPSYMDFEVVEGLPPIQEGVKPCVMKIPTPWNVFAEPGISAYVLPATYHADVFDDLYLYPGIVDYENFSTINVIFSPLRPCKVLIKAGTPLLQVLPFRREPMVASCTKATEHERDIIEYGNYPWRKTRAFYRKLFHHKKQFRMLGEPDE